MSDYNSEGQKAELTLVSTPRPWHIACDWRGVERVIDGEDGLTVADCFGIGDAAFIVEAVNSYDQLRRDKAELVAGLIQCLGFAAYHFDVEGSEVAQQTLKNLIAKHKEAGDD